MRRTKKRQNADVLDELGFFPRTRYWRPTEAWEQAWRRNLARAPRRHTAEESLEIKHAVWDWLEQDPQTRPLQKQLAASLGVSNQYINSLIHRLPARTALPPICRSPSLHRQSEVTATVAAPVPVRPVLEGHGWNCDCAGCQMNAVIEAARRQEK